MMNRSSPEQAHLTLFLKSHEDHRANLHDVAASAYNQIRYLGLPRDTSTKLMIRQAMRIALMTDGEALDSRSSMLALIMKKASAPYPAPGASVESDETLNFFRHFFKQGGADKMGRLARAATDLAMKDPACNSPDGALEDHPRSLGHALAVAANDTSLRHSQILDAMEDYIAIAVSNQLDVLFQNHDRYMAAIARCKSWDLKQTG